MEAIPTSVNYLEAMKGIGLLTQLLLSVRADSAPAVPGGRACAALERAEKLAANVPD